MVAWPIDLWNQWAIPITVLFSFTLQVVLLVFAGTRRREASPVPTGLLWLAYQLSDSTARYALNLFSIISTETRDHELIAFWVPFLLLHLGGPDNITALSLEDNQLWKRHLLTIFAQVLTAVYVLYRLVSTSGSLVLMVATMLIFAVGVVKYAEKICALKCGNLDDIRSSLNNSQVQDDSKIIPEGIHGMYEDQEVLEIVHSQFHFCKLKLVDSSVTMKRHRLQYYDLGWAKTWKLMAMELSLLYDILYTKASVTHTRTGYMVRFAAPPAIAAALALFQLHLMMTSGGTDGHKHRRVDVAITYALMAGTFFMEVTALLGAIGSTWTLAFLSGLPPRSSIRHALVCSGRWHQLRRLLLPLSRLDVRRRSWSGTIGQYNLLHLCTSDSDDHLIGRLAAMLGLKEWWTKFHYSGSIVVPNNLKELLFDECKLQMSDRKKVNGLGLLRMKWGDVALKRHELSDHIRGSVGGVELQEDIVMWHIATDVYLANRVVRDGDHIKVTHIEVLSNYMMFLLVNHPYLLPGLVLHRMYDTTRANLVKIWSRERHCKNPKDLAGAQSFLEKLFRLHDEPLLSLSMTMVSQRNQLAKILHELVKKIAKEEESRMSGQNKDDNTSSKSKLENDELRKSYMVDPFYHSAFRVEYGARIAYKLLTKDNEEPKSLDVIRDVWLDFLFYVANKCSRESYAKKLSSGIELTPMLWLMGAHFQPCTPTPTDKRDTMSYDD